MQNSRRQRRTTRKGGEDGASSSSSAAQRPGAIHRSGAVRASRGEREAEAHRLASLQRQLSIQQQISMLRWRKSQASAKMRTILQRSSAQRRADAEDTRRARDVAHEHSQWMYSVVESEMQRPLEVDDAFIQRYTKGARRDYENLERDTRHHIDIVTKLKKDLLQKEENRRRWVTYKEKREAYGLTPGPLDDGDGRAATPGGLQDGDSALDPLTVLGQQKATPSNIVERLEDLDALEHHLQSVRKQWANKEPSFLENPGTDLFLLRVPQNIASGSLTGGSMEFAQSEGVPQGGGL
mgnify:CR=1 FL=1|jgi:hypothetical protein